MENITPSSEPYIVVGDSALTPEHRDASAILRANEFMGSYTKKTDDELNLGLNPEKPITREVAKLYVGYLATVADIDPKFVEIAIPPYKRSDVKKFLPLLEVLSADPVDSPDEL
ncbi:MAG: hypothetical protein WCJ86_00790 [Candidatus Saccharibacteria bacterium]